MTKFEYIPRSETERELIEAGYDPTEAHRYAEELKEAGSEAAYGDARALGKVAAYYKIIGEEEKAEELVGIQISVVEETVTYNWVTKGIEYEYDWANQRWREAETGRFAKPDIPDWEVRLFRYPWT
jgi:hypothetical protein